RRNGSSARALGRRVAGQRDGARSAAVVRQVEIVPQQLGGRDMTHMAGHSPKHFLWEARKDVGTIRLNRPDRKNPLTFDAYAELRDTFRALSYADDVNAVVFLPNGRNFCSGGDVHDIIGPLVGMDMKALLAFTRMTGDLV